MISDLNRRAPNTVLTPLIIIRWIMAFGQLLGLMAAESLWNTDLPATPILCLIGASAVLNLYATRIYKGRQAPEEIVRLHVIFDILQLTGILYLTGGLENPFRILLLCPLALAASLLSLFSLCLMIMLTILCVSVISFIYIPLDWFASTHDAEVHIQQLRWIPLTMTSVLVSFIIWRLAMSGRQINEALQETQAILALKQQNSALGALAAAAVHELGSPLSTIAVISREIERDLLPDDPLFEDIALLKAQSEKCKKILADIASNPVATALDSTTLRLDRLLMELVSSEDTEISINIISRTPENLPTLRKTPNIEYGLGNLIGNASSFSHRAVTIIAEADADTVSVIIQDDGPGFPPEVLRQIGKPYISSRESREGHLGLGIFIAINLLESTEGQVAFRNASRGGGQVEITWPRRALELEDGSSAV